MGTPPDDQTLLARFQRSGAPDDLLPLYRRYAEMIYGWCLRYLGTPERAEDAGAEVFTVLLHKLPEYEVDNFRPWLQSLVRNHCLMQLRKEKRDPLRLSVAPAVQSSDFLHPGSMDEPETPDIRPLHRCMKELSAEQRECIRWFYLREGESYRSIARRLNLSVGRVRSHLQNGRRNLRRCMERPNAGTNEINGL